MNVLEAQVDKSVTDVFPTTDDLVLTDPVLDCEICGRTFQNHSACRLHRIKVHKIVDVEKSTEMRLLQRFTGETVNRVFHCPDESCSKCFSSFSDLKQHYIRTHTEKKFGCEDCGYKCALEKDVKYHKRTRCTKLKSKDGEPMANGKRKKQQQQQQMEGSSELKKFAPPGSTVVAPVILVVSANDVQQVVENLQYSLENSTTVVGTRPTIKVVNSATNTQDIIDEQMTFVNVPAYEQGHDHGFEHQNHHHQNVNSCERGTGMDSAMASTSMQYYPPPAQYDNGFTANTNDNNSQKSIGYGYDDQMQSNQATGQTTRSFGTTMTYDRPIGYEYVGEHSQADETTQSNPETRNFGTTMAFDRPQGFDFVGQNGALPPQTRNFGTTMSFDTSQNPGFGYMDQKPMETRSFGTTMTHDRPQEFGMFEQKPSVLEHQTRNFGTTTAFDSVSTRHTGTSMSDEDFVSLYLRDTETQTPNFLEQPTTSADGEPNREEWPWRME